MLFLIYILESLIKYMLVSRMASAVQLLVNPDSIFQVELHPSPEPIWPGSGISLFQKELTLFSFSRLWELEWFDFELEEPRFGPNRFRLVCQKCGNGIKEDTEG